MKEGDKVKSNGKYHDIDAKFGDTIQTVLWYIEESTGVLCANSESCPCKKEAKK